ncbi:MULTISPECIES: flagellar hook assembly protein FlgD [Hydrogenophaga]|uniref:flagellar hook assembly protein FlgD n=1 Tax=Hydrogenophaga TaxID=47420 RepID=UPI001CF98CFB|nr:MULTISPECIES: flagellar hook capping FlgD N-terminal domain-containing protein [Hydrogenophaga]MDO9033440.1 flagellar hook capping FlgD N-terminal domain-containing protein [Hydrogenophaga sp.]UCU95407.1 flagellar hook assembly protein FlgD [Hydrogenophaga taeniospiralis]
MLTSALDLSNLGTTVGSTTAVNSNNASDPQASQDRFLKLLVAQINNQDPLNPMDNAQMTTQMAQINTVSGIQELNATLKGMAEQSAALGSLQGAALIGRQALVEGDALAFDGSTGKGAFNLAADAGSVEVDVMGSTGQVLDTVKLGAKGAGQHSFSWDAGSIDPASVSRFVVRSVATGGEAVANTALSPQRIDSVSFANGAISLQLANGRAVAYDQARGFM